MPLSLEHLVRGAAEVSSLPELYYKLDEAINAPNSSFSLIADIVAEDTGLTARLLRISNSALYGFPSKIETVQRAMSVIGTKQIRELVLATSVIAVFNGMSNDHVSMESFWKHSIATGIVARIMATVRREHNVERFFVLGLLHDIGRLLMFSKAPQDSHEALKLAETNNILLFQAEKQVFGYHHADVGRALLAQWRLPSIQQEVVGAHHNLSRAKVYPLEASTIHVADVIANAFNLGSSGETFVPALNQSAWDRLDIPPNQLTTIATQLKKQYNEAVNLFLNN